MNTIVKTVDDLEVSITTTVDFIHSVIASGVAKRALLDLIKVDRDVERSEKEKEQIRVLKFMDGNEGRVYEMGYINMFSHFEYFQFCLVKQLLLTYPKSIPQERKLSFDELSMLTSIKEMKNYYIETVALEEAISIVKFESFLAKHNIILFNDQKIKNQLLILNSLRNIFLHGNSTTNAKFKSEIEKLGIKGIKLGTPINLDREEYFNNLNRVLLAVIKQLRKEVKKFKV